MSDLRWRHTRKDGKLCVFGKDEVVTRDDKSGLFNCKCGEEVSVDNIDLVGKRKQRNPYDLIQDDIHQADILKQEGI